MTTKKEETQELKKDNPEQSKRFVETAKELDADESGNSFERVLGRIKTDNSNKKENQQRKQEN